VTQANKQPDIEIYIKNGSPKDLFTWLRKYFVYDTDDVETKIADGWDKKSSISCLLKAENSELTLLFTPNAAGKAYRSIWFQSNLTPWLDDKACALSLLESFDGEVRCSESSWTEDEEEMSQKWWVLTRDEERLVTWG